MTDYCEVTWSPTRAAAIVRMTVDEIPFDECDEAAHQLLACGNLARRINTRPAKRELTEPNGRPVVPIPMDDDWDPSICSTCRDTGAVPALLSNPDDPSVCRGCGRPVEVVS